jgi:hypothetical protein
MGKRNVGTPHRVARDVNAYLWHDRGDLAHHMRAQSVDEVRERIAATHGEDIARRAVIKPIQQRGDPKPAAA